MRLNREQLGNALSLALLPQIPLRQTRAGEPSMWNGCATVSAIRGGVFAAQLAALGLTGPLEPFEGKDGLWERVSGPFDFGLPARPDSFVMEQTSLKLHPLEYHSQSFLDLVPAILERVSVPDIASIEIQTYWRVPMPGDMCAILQHSPTWTRNLTRPSSVSRTTDRRRSFVRQLRARRSWS